MNPDKHTGSALSTTRGDKGAKAPDVPAATSGAIAGKTGVFLPRLAVNIEEAASMLGVSRDFFDEHVRHELRCVRRGRLKLFPVAELERWLERSAGLALD